MCYRKTKFRHNTRSRDRRGTIAVMASFLAVVLLGMVAFAVDIGYVLSAQEELQRTADAAALTTVWEFSQQLADGNDKSAASQAARPTASVYGASNTVANQPVNVDLNAGNSVGGGVVFGHIDNFFNPSAVLDPSAVSSFNAARVTIARGDGLNDELPMFFARIFGHARQTITADATAAVVRDVPGFTAPSDGSNLGMIPIALDLETWDAMLAGAGDDNWS